MKNTLSFCIVFLCLFSAPLAAQSTYTHRTILKTEPFHIASGQINIWAEKHFSRKSAIEFAVGYIFSDYLDAPLLPDFVKKEQIQKTEGYILRTNYRKYKNIITETQTVSKYFQIDFFVKVIDYQPLHKGTHIIHGLKDVVGLSLNWGKPVITEYLWSYDVYAGLGMRIKFYHTEKYIQNNGQWIPAPGYEITRVLPFVQAGVKFGKVIDKKKALAQVIR